MAKPIRSLRGAVMQEGPMRMVNVHQAKTHLSRGTARSPAHPWATAQLGVQPPAAGGAAAMSSGDAYLLDSHALLWCW